MSASSAFRILLCLAGLAVAATDGRAQAAPRADSVPSAARLEAFAKAHIAVSELRAQVQAELADKKTKKLPEQGALREKLHQNTVRLLKEHGLTELEFARLTQQVSVDTALRRGFDSLLARLPGGKTP